MLVAKIRIPMIDFIQSANFCSVRISNMSGMSVEEMAVKGTEQRALVLSPGNFDFYIH